MSISRERVGAVYLVFSVLAGLACLGLLWGSADSLLQFSASVGCGIAAYLLGRVGNRLRVPAFRDLEEISDLARHHQIPVAVYLRRFHEDTYAGGQSSDQQIALGLGSYALFVAIGRPGEELPTQGAFRLYVADEQWRDVVRELLSMASLVFLRWAPGGHLGWELEQVKQGEKLHRTAFVVPKLPMGADLREFLPEQIFPLIDAEDLRGRLQDSPTLLTLREDGTALILSLPEETSDQDDRMPLEHMACALAKKLSLPLLDRSKRIALRRLYGRPERIALIVGTISAVIPSLTVAFCAVFLLDALTPFSILPLGWDLDLILSVFGGLILASVVVFFLGSLLVSSLTGRS